ncbi:hypothetical protein MRS44_012931 [Fusarium solani]|uniref:Uncharacterized protein n=1 Tax=Fusarium solani TaxID=169388 RepID=A0A9P9GMD3_FUSSL|nr:uncharacterized protein B0J15DRAFT_502300 [Fusarium solani]KAH7240532.1 hypothetical protein B0J15DRAFT_502300 [Fusarium solani]KAJ3458822.1 hypothetical protein MRS44_012931 [Fusarium solani]
MCWQLLELYSACRCLYYQHTIDRCASYGRPGHSIEHRTIFVGYACSAHSGFSRGAWGASGAINEKSQASTPPAQQPYDNSLEILSAIDPKDSDNEGEDNFSDNESILSSNSAPSTSLTVPVETYQEAIEALFRDILNDFNLRYLWPQVVRISSRRDLAEREISRLLKRFSVDLKKAAETRLHQNAAKLVRTARLNIAQRIVICHAAELDPFDQPDACTPVRLPEDEEIVDEERERSDEERNIVYERVHEFIFQGAAFEQFTLAMKLHVAKSSVPEKSALRLYSLRQCFEVLVSRIWGSPARPTLSRLSWSCRCGQTGHDAYLEKREGALEELETLLQNYKEKTLEMARSIAPADSSSTGNASHFVSKMKSVLSISLRRQGSRNLPKHQQDTDKGSMPGEACLITSNKEPSSLDPQHRFLLICAPFMQRATKAHQPDVCMIHSDRDLFKALRRTYSKCRKGYRWRWFRRVASIEFVKFEFFLSELVNIQQCPSLPGRQDRAEYDFEQVDLDPPIGPNLLSHLFENPDHAEVLPVLFNRIPKKMRKRLSACPRKGSSTGWGISFVESLDTFAVFLCGCIGFTLSLVAAVVYTVIMGDIQGGFAIGAFLLAFVLFCGGCLHSLPI